MFFHDSQVGLDDAKGVGTVVGALGDVVVEGRSRINEETQHVVALFAQAPQQVSGRRLFNQTMPPWCGMYCRSD